MMWQCSHANIEQFNWCYWYECSDPFSFNKLEFDTWYSSFSFNKLEFDTWYFVSNLGTNFVPTILFLLFLCYAYDMKMLRVVHNTTRIHFVTCLNLIFYIQHVESH